MWVEGGARPATPRARRGGAVSLLAAHGLSVRAGGRLILHDIDLSVERGEIVTVVGPNGAGKTTLLRALLGSVPATGRIEHAPGLRIGYVPQRLQLDATLPLTVGRFLRLGARRGADGVSQALADTGVPDLSDRQMSALSGGQFQRVLLSRALLAEPDLLMLDEPAQGLDQPGVAALYRLVETIRSRLHCGVLMISHDLHVVMRAADSVIGLNGIIWWEGPPTVVSSGVEYHALFGDLEQDVLAIHRREARDAPPDTCSTTS